MSSEDFPTANGAEADGAEEVKTAESPEANPSGRVLDLKDPKAMRAIAHPVRMALLDLLSGGNTLTATQAGEALGESPANCAFHLRTLAKYGYVMEAGGGKGRERPWKAAHHQINLSLDQEDAATRMAARSLNEFWLGRVLQRAQQILTNPDEWPAGWMGAVEATQSHAYLTPDELREFSKEVHALLNRYKSRRADPADRPAGALPVESLFLAYPLQQLAERTPEAAPEE